MCAVGLDGTKPDTKADFESNQAEVEGGSVGEDSLAVPVGQVVHALHPGDGA